jgi:hypothetical protein
MPPPSAKTYQELVEEWDELEEDVFEADPPNSDPLSDEESYEQLKDKQWKLINKAREIIDGSTAIERTEDEKAQRLTEIIQEVRTLCQGWQNTLKD